MYDVFEVLKTKNVFKDGLSSRETTRHKFDILDEALDYYNCFKDAAHTHVDLYGIEYKRISILP